MQAGALYLETKNEPEALPISNIKVYDFYYWIFAWPGACVNIQGYCEEDFEPNTPSTMFDNTFTLDLILVSLEYNTSTGEWEFRVGQGIILGATWSPKSGFGVQFGVGAHTTFFGINNFEAGAYLEGNSEGLTAHLEGSASTVLGPGLEKDIVNHVVQLELVCTAMEPCPLPRE